MKLPIILTICGYGALFVSISTTVCPVFAHLPLFAFLLTMCIVVVAASVTVRGYRTSRVSALCLGALIACQLSVLTFIAWAYMRTPAGQL